LILTVLAPFENDIFTFKKAVMDILNDIKKLKTIADIGLLYAKDGYDVQRYEEIKAISKRLMSVIIEQPVEVIKNFYSDIKDYPTPKVDIRALVLNKKNQILLVQESADDRWALPGGWADIGNTPSEVAVKEVFEEAGLVVEARRLLAVFDKRNHPHPPQPYYVYKMVIGCKNKASTEGVLRKGFDILDAAYFDITHLPPLSENRILASQIHIVYGLYLNKNSKTYFD
jgi:ADP-ribose pyrophosphatase YjhB (NUDIX family)